MAYAASIEERRFFFVRPEEGAAEESFNGRPGRAQGVDAAQV